MKTRLQDGHSFKNLLAYVFVVLTILRNGKCCSDPCVGVASLGDSRRTATEETGTCSGICDNDIREDWYRLDAFNSGDRMPESSVKVCHCGTYIPIWLNGSHPTPENPGPVTIPVCAQLRPGGPICEWQDKIDVKRCYAGIEYFIYKLKPTPFCDMAYCGGVRISCANNVSWNDITKSCTNPRTPPLNVKPTLSAPYISSTKPVTDDTGKAFTATQFSMKCTLSYTQQTVDNGARYDVIFQSDSQVVYTKTLKSTDSPVVEMNESYLAGRVGQTVICNVTSYWQSQFPTRSPYQFSNAYKFDIYFVDADNVRRTNLTITESTSVKIYVKASFLITTPWCFNLTAGSTCYPYYTFLLTSNNLLVSVCTFRLASDTKTSGDIWVSSVPDVSAYAKTGNIYFQTDRSDQSQNSIFGSYNTSSALSVTINDPTPWPLCQSWGDPHIKTFDTNYYYHVYLIGDFVLLEVPAKNIKIHVRQYQCGSRVTGNCGVIAREGNNVLGINACGSSTLVERYLYDETNPGGTIRYQGGSKWIITLPSGIRITVDVSGNNIQLHVEGDGFESVRRGMCTHSISKQCDNCECWDECDTAFRISGSESLFNYTRNNPPPCLDTKPPIVPQCSCQNGASSNRVCTVPDNTDLTPSKLAISKCKQSSNRQKRQSSFVTEKPKIYSEQSLPNLHWPTRSGITESQANDACNSKITQSGVYYLCVRDLQVNVTQLIQLCVMDIQISDDKVFPPSILATQMEVICKWTIDKAYNGTTSSVQQEYVANVCPKQCSQNGKCNNGKCTCNTGYMSDDCSVQQEQVPEIQSLAPATCDVRTSVTSCREVRLYATGVSSDHPVCQIKNATKVIFLDTSPSVSGGLVTCNLPQVPVNPGIAFSEAVVSYTVYVSISNNATSMKFSNEMKFIIYDGLCVTCDVSSGCQNTRTACNILGRCYNNATVMYCGNNNTDPRVCNPAISNTKWLPMNSADGSKGLTTSSSSRPAAATTILLFAYIFIKLVKEKYMQPN